MSALPRIPIDQEPPERPVGRALWIRIAIWVAAGIGILILLVVIGIAVLLRSQKVHEYVLKTAQQKLTDSLGVPVRAREFTLSWSGISPSVDLYDVVVSGAAPYANPPLLTVDHMGVQVRITSLVRRTWYLNDITINRPIARVFIDAQGNSNLPHPKSSAGQSNTDLFDLGIRHALLDRGEVYYNDKKSVLDADLHDVTFRSAFDPSQKKYAGTLSYRNGHLKMGTFNPLEHNLEASFAATPNAFALERAVLSSGNSKVNLVASVQSYTRPDVQATYEASIDAGDFRRIMKNQTIPLGVIRASGKIHYITQAGRPLLETTTVNGSLSSRLLAVNMPTFRGDIRDIAAQYSLANGNVDVTGLRANLLGGILTGTLAMRDIAGNSRSRLQAELRGVSLAELKPLLNSPAAQQVALAGSVNAIADASWGKTIDNLKAKADATLQARVSPGNNPSGAVPVDGVIHANYFAAKKQIQLANSYVRMPATSLTMNGSVSNRSSLRVELRSNDLHELENVAQMFQPSTGKPVQPLDLHGTASFVGNVSGSTDAPRIKGLISAANVQLKGTSWRVLRANVDASPSVASLQDGLLQPAQRGQIRFSLSAALRKWAFTDQSAVKARLNATQINIADFAKLAGLQTPVSGTLAADVAVEGSQLNPVGQGTIRVTNATVSNQPIQVANLTFHGTGDQVVANAVLRIPAGSANAVVNYSPKNRAYDAELHANGIQLAQLQAVKAKNLQLAGVLNVNATGRGTVDNPGLEATVEVPRLDIQKQTINGLTLKTAVANHVANFALDTQVVNTYARARGTISLAGDYLADVSLDTQAIPLTPLIAAYAPSQAGSVNGQTELHATLRGPLKNTAQLDAHLVIPTLSLNYNNTVQLAAASPIRVDYRNGVIQVQRSAIRGTDTNLEFQGNIPVKSTEPLSLLLLGTVNLQLAQLFDPDISSSGQLKFDINSYGMRNNPDVQGRIQIVNAMFTNAGTPLGLQKGNGVLTLTKNRLDITQFQGEVGGGRVTASGGVVYRPAMRFDVALAGQGIRVLYPGGIRAGLDTNLALVGNMENAVLRGQTRINQLSFTPDFDLMNFVSQFGGVTAPPPPTTGFASNLQLDIGVQSTTGVNLVSRTLSLQGNANLNVRGTAAEPVITGRANLNGGDLIFMGNRYVIQGGTIDFPNTFETQPVVNVNVNTTVQQYNISMRFWGPVDHLHTTYLSDPSLPPSDIINLIAFGKTNEASAANPATPGNLGAESLIASQVSSQITNRVEKIAGISQLSIDPVLGGTASNGQNPGARITIQQRVTGKIFVTFSTDVTSTQDQVIQLQYQVSPRLSVSGTRDQNGGFGFDARIRKTW